MGLNNHKQHKKKKTYPAKKQTVRYLEALVADEQGQVFELPGYGAVGMAGSRFVPLEWDKTVSMPHGSELMLLPDRIPMVYNIRKRKIELLPENPFEPGEKIFPVALFNSPGFTNVHVCAYAEREGAGYLPLFSYGAAGWGENGFRTSVIHVDKERRQDLRLMPKEKIDEGVRTLRKKYPDNRLRKHLEHCALVSGCPAAKNFFIGRCEAPLPTSQFCNARCLGCISLQKTQGLSCCQERISFTPTPDEIAELALAHIGKVPDGVVSFGQGCEGDPLLVVDVIEEAVKLIRQKTKEGTVNINTNASLPDHVDRVFAAGMDSIRVSMNSVRESCYTAYFRPKGYGYGDVLESIKVAAARGGHVALNYFYCPGVSDTPEEFETLIRFLENKTVHLIQWRNLNYDPLRYYQVMKDADSQGDPLGMHHILMELKHRFPKLKHGYFNPSKQTF